MRRGVFEVAAIELLPFDVVVDGWLSRLHADVHHQQRQPKGCGGEIVVVPGGLHGFVGQGTAGVVAAAVGHVLFVLVVGEDEVCLVVAALEAQFECVVGGAVHGPVVGTYDALVVVREGLASRLQEQAVAGVELSPGFIDIERGASRLSPDAGLAEVYFGGEI